MKILTSLSSILYWCLAYSLLSLSTQALAEASRELGSFDVDKEASARALERSLVQSGSLLLSPGQFDFETGGVFSHSENEILLFIDANGNTTFGQTKQKRSRIDIPFRFRVGLPYDSQVDFSIPFNSVSESSIVAVGNDNLLEIDNRGTGVGDARLTFSKTLLREKNTWPDIIARVSWDADNGKKTDNNVSLGGAGFNEYRVGITATKRQDPLVFSSTLFAQSTSEEKNIKPGNQYGLTFGAFLAASPATSLRFSLDQIFADDIEVNGKKIAGSDRIVSILNIGASSVIESKTFVSLSTGIGLTDDSPDYIVNLSWASRFDVF